MDVNKKRPSIVGVCIFIVYLMGLFYFLFFAEGMGRTGDGTYRYNLTLLKEIRRFIEYREILGWKAFMLNVVGNIAAFVPFGCILPMLRTKRKNVFVITLWGFILSLFVELIQLCLRIGSFDVDDLLLNTIGALLGSILYWIVKSMRSKKSDS